MFRLHDFFPKLNGDWINLRWSHATNTQHDLRRALSDERIQLLESDLVFSAEENKIFMAHPPKTCSDLSFCDYLEIASDQLLSQFSPKGLKLDFKSQDAFISSIPQIYRFLGRFSSQIPVFWLNADICASNPELGEPKVDPGAFLRQSKAITEKFYCVGLSVGWNLQGSAYYSSIMIDNMLNLIQDFDLKCDIAYAISADSLHVCFDEIVRLWKSNPEKHFISFWTNSSSSAHDEKIRKALHAIREVLPRDKVLYDIPDRLLPR